MSEHDTVQVEDEILAEGFTQVPNGILKHPTISPGAKLAYAVLLSYAWAKDRSFPGQASMARDMAVSERSVTSYLKELKDAQLVVIKRRGLGLTNVYILKKLVRSAKSANQDRQESTVQESRKLRTKNTQLKNQQVDRNKTLSDEEQFERYRRSAEEVGGIT